MKNNSFARFARSFLTHSCAHAQWMSFSNGGFHPGICVDFLTSREIECSLNYAMALTGNNREERKHSQPGEIEPRSLNCKAYELPTRPSCHCLARPPQKTLDIAGVLPLIIKNCPLNLRVCMNELAHRALWFIYGHFADALVLSTTWNDLFWSSVDDMSLWWQFCLFTSEALVPI